jgi:CMP/dCMP kinase
MPAHYPEVLADLRSRDQRDMCRTAAPLFQAPDADLLDTSDLGIEESSARALALIKARLAGAGAE